MPHLNKLLSLGLYASFPLTLAAGCSAEAGELADDTVSAEAALCENKDGVNAAMSALGVAAAREMRRILPYRDFAWNSNTGRLETTSYGRARCSNSVCPNVEAILALQNAPANTVMFPGNVALNPTSLRSALKQNWSEQNACASSTCVQLTHDLQYTQWESGSCDVKYFFKVFKQGSSTQITDTTQLNAYSKNLIFLGYPENKMLNFYIRNSQISLDPTPGTNVEGVSYSGSCLAVCTRYSATNIAGACCACNGVSGKFARSTFSSSFYLCK